MAKHGQCILLIACTVAKYDLWSSDRIHAEIKHDPISGLEAI